MSGDQAAAQRPAQAAIGLFELVLEVADLAAAERFYHDVIGLPVAQRWEPPRPATWLALGREGFLGLWPRETGGEAAIHRGRGGAHVHFAIRVPGALWAWQAQRDAGPPGRARPRGRGRLGVWRR